jgi:hypothetical protein
MGSTEHGATIFQVFDPSTNTLSIPVTNGSFVSVTDINQGSSTSTVVGGLIYLIQIGTNLGDSCRVDVYDPSANTWKNLQTTGGIYQG